MEAGRERLTGVSGVKVPSELTEPSQRSGCGLVSPMTCVLSEEHRSQGSHETRAM